MGRTFSFAGGGPSWIRRALTPIWSFSFVFTSRSCAATCFSRFLFALPFKPLAAAFILFKPFFKPFSSLFILLSSVFNSFLAWLVVVCPDAGWTQRVSVPPHLRCCRDTETGGGGLSTHLGVLRGFRTLRGGVVGGGVFLSHFKSAFMTSAVFCIFLGSVILFISFLVAYQAPL